MFTLLVLLLLFSIIVYMYYYGITNNLGILLLIDMIALWLGGGLLGMYK